MEGGGREMEMWGWMMNTKGYSNQNQLSFNKKTTFVLIQITIYRVRRGRMIRRRRVASRFFVQAINPFAGVLCFFRRFPRWSRLIIWSGMKKLWRRRRACTRHLARPRFSKLLCLPCVPSKVNACIIRPPIYSLSPLADYCRTLQVHMRSRMLCSLSRLLLMLRSSCAWINSKRLGSLLSWR